MTDLRSGLWIRETGTVQQVAQLHDRYMIMSKTNKQTNVHKFKICKSVRHHTIQINQPTKRNNFSSLLLGVYVQLNMFRVSSRPSLRAQQLQKQPLVLPLERRGSTATTTFQR
jgi:hypothetical protein